MRCLCLVATKQTATDMAEYQQEIPCTQCNIAIYKLSPNANFLFLDFQCDCKGNEKCEATKGNVEPCRAEVVHATRPNTVVTCSAAEWICAADPQV